MSRFINNRVFVKLSVLSYLFFYKTSFVSAVGWVLPANPGGLATDFDATVINLINWLLGFITAFAVLAIVWGGIKYISSSGSQEQAQGAKKTVQYALIGLIVAGIAFALVNLVVTKVLT